MIEENGGYSRAKNWRKKVKFEGEIRSKEELKCKTGERKWQEKLGEENGEECKIRK